MGRVIVSESFKNENFNNAPLPTVSEETEAVQRLEAWLRLDQQRRKISYHEGQIEAIEETGGGRFEYVYDQQGDLTQIIEANGRATTYQYDSQRRLVRVGYPDGTDTRYTYGENDRLVQIDDRGMVNRFEYDATGRVIKIQRGNASASVYRYDRQGQVIEARTSTVSTQQEFDAAGRVIAIHQALNGITLNLRLEYDRAGRLMSMFLPGSACPIRYQWDSQGRPQTVSLDNRRIAEFEYLEEQKIARIHLANGIIEETRADVVDTRPVLRQVLKDDQILFQREYTYSPTGQVVDDSVRRYEYDPLGRLSRAEGVEEGSQWGFSYDYMDNRISAQDFSDTYRFRYDSDNRLIAIEQPDGSHLQISYDRFDRPIRKCGPAGQWVYRYNDANQLLQVLHRGDSVAQFIYDHKGRLVLGKFADRTERYLYGPDDELLAITDEKGNPQRLYVRTPLGTLAEIHGSVDSSQVYFLHHDERGSCHLVSDQHGEVVAQFRYTPFGIPSNPGIFLPIFNGRVWNPEIEMYPFGARWYDPYMARFLTPDSYTGAPDDERIVHPIWPASRQVFSRSEILRDWLKRPRLRNRYAYCGNDPLNRADPNGHWSFGGVLLSLLGAIWTLPNTLFGLLVEITCLMGEVVRWLVWLVSLGHVTWATPGFDAAASGRLNAFALVFKGGWLGSFSSLLGITFGNVFFVYKDWETHSAITALSASISPPAYGGKVSIPREQALYEHELRHTSQYGWFGPFFHLGLPLFGVYEWDVILNGYQNAWLERDARKYGGF